MEDKEILSYIEDFDNCDLQELIRKMGTDQKGMEEKMKDLENKGLIKITWGDESVGEGESIDYIHWVEITEEGKNILGKK